MTIRAIESNDESNGPPRSILPSARLRLLALSVLAFLCGVGTLAASDSVSSLKRDLRQALGRDQGAATRAIDGLVAIGSPEAVEEVCDHAFLIDSPDLERHALGRLLELPEDGPGIRRLAELCNEHKDHRVRLALTYVLKNRPEKVAFTAVVQNVYDRFEAVRLTALEAIRQKGALAPMETLIEALAMEEEKGRDGDLIAFEIRKTLTELTNRDFEFAADWKNFWAANKDGFQRPSDLRERKTSVTSVKREPPVFFGQEINTKRFLFLLDVSGSMSKKDPLPEDEPERTGGATTSVGGKKKKEPPTQEEIPDSRRRLSRVQKELIGVISKLPPDVHFNIITFNHEIGTWKTGLVNATDRNKRDAIQFVEGFRAEGETHTDEALAKAFENANINTIFLLSDGAPRRDNTLLDTDPILQWVRDQNRFRRIRIHSVTFEQCGGKLRQFMKDLSRQNQGEYAELR